MSRQNVELVRVVHEGWARGDFGVGADLLSADFSWEQHADAVEAGSRRGAEVGRSLRNIFDVYDEYRIEADEFIDAGDQVVVAGRARGIAKTSRMELDQRFAFVWTVRRGALARVRVFTDRDEALEAAGLAK
jgi:ketosteroid isomerase-like protein